jgi:diguanylate cyclase (GGDEF)-like protein
MNFLSRKKTRNGSADGASGSARPAGAHFAPAEFFAAIAGLPGVVIYQRLVTPDGQIRYTYISENAYDLFGVPAEEIISDPRALFSCHSADYSAKFRERLLAASRGLMTWDVEASIVSRDGRKKYTHAIARPDRKPDGSVLWTGIILDETRTRTAVLESLSQGILLFDADGCLILRNRSFLELLPSLRDIAVPGARYEDIVRDEVTGGRRALLEDPELFDSPVYQEFARRMDGHREPHVMYERQIEGDRWLLVNEHHANEGTVVLFTDITELKRGERQIRHLAYHDGLTGLSNRVVFHQRVEEALARAKERGTTIAVLCLDLDHFKNVNDTLGHPAGDELLKVVAARLRSCLRDTDTVARLGGDEFGIVVTDLQDPDYATTLAWRLLDAVSQPVDLNGQQAVTSASIGIVMSAIDLETTQLLKNADLALYRAKADGRATFRFFEAEMDARAQERRMMEMDLRHAVARGQLELHYQAQVDLYSDQILGFEALVRWRHPERGLIAPGAFIPLAEETGLIIRLGEWVIRQACADAARWPKPVRVAVNVSPAQFKDEQLVSIIARALEDSGLAPDRLEIEITESLLLRDAEANLKMLQELRDLGVHISMDDFGTGYSSLQNLRSFPFDKIKIDQSFVSDLERRPDAPAIIRAVLGLGQSLGMITCAEGVETEQQLNYLRDEGCIEVQGYYYSRPKPAAEAVRLLEEGLSGTACHQLASAGEPGGQSASAPTAPHQPGKTDAAVAAFVSTITRNG